MEENLVKITVPPWDRLNHEMNLCIVTERLNSMGANVYMEEPHFIEVLEDIMK